MYEGNLATWISRNVDPEGDMEEFRKEYLDVLALYERAQANRQTFEGEPSNLVFMSDNWSALIKLSDTQYVQAWLSETVPGSTRFKFSLRIGNEILFTNLKYPTVNNAAQHDFEVENELLVLGRKYCWNYFLHNISSYCAQAVI